MSDKTREDVEILGVNHTLAIDPDSLNEAGVVWAPAVRALASAVAPIVVADAEARRSSSAVASSSSVVDSSTDRRAPTTRILELGAGTGALGIALACAVPDVDVTLTDLDRVVPLMRTNADATRDAGKLARGSELRVAELAWSRDAVLGLDDAPGGGGGGGVDRRDGGARWDVVLGCEILYWGGWDVFADDTRGPLLEACVAACEAGAGAEGVAEGGAEGGAASPPQTLVALAFTVRDKGRESGYVAGDFGEKFWLRLLDGAGTFRRVTDEEDARRMDAEARARIEAAEEGDLVVLGAVAKRRK